MSLVVHNARVGGTIASFMSHMHQRLLGAKRCWLFSGTVC